MDKKGTCKVNPFNWGVDMDNSYISQPTQRNAKYIKTAEGEYKGGEYDAYYGQTAPVYTQVSNICGIDCPDGQCES